jgi:hypothetical protein
MIELETCLARGCCRFSTIPPITTHYSQTTANAEVEFQLAITREMHSLRGRCIGIQPVTYSPRSQPESKCAGGHAGGRRVGRPARGHNVRRISADVQRLSTFGIPRPSQKRVFSSDRRIYLPCGRTLDGSFTLAPRSEKRVTSGIRSGSPPRFHFSVKLAMPVAGITR